MAGEVGWVSGIFFFLRVNGVCRWIQPRGVEEIGVVVGLRFGLGKLGLLWFWVLRFDLIVSWVDDDETHLAQVGFSFQRILHDDSLHMLMLIAQDILALVN